MSLRRLLEEQQSRLGTLIQLLENEQEQLLRGSIDGPQLENIAQEKSRLLAILEETESTRARIQLKLGYTTGGEGARQAAEDAGCLYQWQATLEMTAHTARLNDRNGRLVSLRMTHNRQMLDYIHSIADKSVYAPDGRTTSGQRRLSTSA
ncbi:flagellar export chaperone FlgN [Halomonas sp. LR5S13]|uniref:flagella synthesis protein FlgN n=1 Tax=Halomonas rhizosphaerae TaxID=3043296 RepID=UPI0024A8E1CB|nr:flagellar export chaperone FlgN [Halomonas rhizosphaerae]MDI5922824.1 flagellar export chaperone FlgN [Halomonas rhizosphaerae]